MSAEALVDEPLVRDLSKGANLPGSPAQVEFKFTHGSLVFLAGDSAYKIKRAKDYGFFDYTEIGSRQHFCREEIRLNRRTAPDVYLGVLPVYRDANGHSLTRSGVVADYAVHMRRLPDERSALALLGAGALEPEQVRAMAQRAARFYAEAESCTPDPSAVGKNFAENFEQVAPFVGDIIERTLFGEVRADQETWLADHQAEIQHRPARDGHGDLRLEHVYFLSDGVVFIDCIEFLDRFRIADPALDAAFLAMDLYRMSRGDLAEFFLGSFAYESDDYDLYPLIDGYMSYRAFVRGKVACFVAADPATARIIADRKRAEAVAMIRLARDLLAHRHPPPRVIAVGGLIGAGKTTVADALAERLHAPIVSADATRKHLAGLGKEERGDAAIYAPSFTAAVQDEILRRAACVLRSGRSVILDTTFQKKHLRERTRALATEHDADFAMVECRVPEAEARRRLRARNRGVSDAGEGLLDAFLRQYEPVDELPPDELTILDTTLPREKQAAILSSRLPTTS